MATFLIVYLPLKRRLADKEKTVEAMRESELHLQRVVQEREQHLRLALEGTNSGLWDWDLSTGMAYYSPIGEKLLGYEPGELEQSIKTWGKLLNPEDREQVMKRLQDHLEGRTSTYESEYRVRVASRASGSGFTPRAGSPRATSRGGPSACSVCSITLPIEKIPKRRLTSGGPSC